MCMTMASNSATSSHQTGVPTVPEKVTFSPEVRKGMKSPSLRSLRWSKGEGIEESDSTGTDSMELSEDLQLTISNLSSAKGCLKYKTQASSLNQKCATTRSVANPNKQVSWGSLSIHSHTILLGDNVCSSGPPLTISWEAFESACIDINEYEAEKPEPRSKAQMLLPKQVREDMLRNAGFPRSSLTEASKRVAEAQENRRRSSRDGKFIEKLSSWNKKSNWNKIGSRKR